jgi:hypothetical protein
MKIRKIIFTTAMSAIVCFGLGQQVQSATDTPDPGALPISNTADGQLALSGVTGLYNSAFGIYACLSNGAASFNTGVGADTLLLNTANENTAVGAATLFSNSTGINNTGEGAFALFFNTTGLDNTAVGNRAMQSNIDGSRHTAVGSHALFNCVAAPDIAGNTAVGTSALFSDTTGNFNTAIGDSAGFNQDTGSNDIYIGDLGSAGESNVIAIGNLPSSGTAYTDFFVGGVFGAAVDATTAVPVLVDAGGKLGTVPVADAPGRQGAGHQAVLNESGHSKFEELQATVAQQQKEIALLTAQLKEQAAQIQKVSAQLQLSKPEPQTVLNTR